MNLTLRNRIYISILSVMVFTILLITIIAAFYIYNQNEVFHEKRILRKQESVLKSMRFFFQQEREDDFFPFYTQEFENKLKEFAEVNATEIILFDLSGNLLTASNMDYAYRFFKNGKIEEDLIEKILNQDDFLLQERVNIELEKMSSFAPLYNLNGDGLAIVSIPYSFVIQEVKAEFVDFLKGMALILAFLLPFSIWLSYILSKYITRSLQIVSDQIAHLTLEKQNEIIEWQHKDEIGSLIEAYNKKVHEIEEAAKKIAATQREEAWREMAKQVAHEIKNPLTPMKLSAQHLQRLASTENPDFKTHLQNFLKGLIDQIDSLSSIAEEFSDFAKMPKAKMESLAVYQEVQNILSIYKSNPNVKIYIEGGSEIRGLIWADKNQLQRVFNNLITNAIQAIPEGKEGVITISLKEDPKDIFISISDNGKGIEKAIEHKIFRPNFTTKSTGSGLGLAMVKNIIKNMKGEIEFNTKLGEGTTFFIKIPILKTGI